MGIDIILGVAGLVITILFASNQIIGFLKRITTKSIFNKKWYSFHISSDDQDNNNVKKGIWNFKRNIFNEITVIVTYEKSSRVYTGELVGVDQHINIILSKVGDQKQYILCRLLNSDEPTIDAVWFGPNDSDTLISDFWFLTLDKKITNDNAKKYIKEKRNSMVSNHKFKTI